MGSVHLGLTMKFFALAFLVAAASAKDIRLNLLAPPTELEYGFCDGSPEPLTFDVISVAPFPILVQNGATMMETSSWQPHQTSSAPPTSQRARLVPFLLDPESTEAEIPWFSDPLSPSRTFSCPSSREPSGPRPQSPMPPARLLPACTSGLP